MAKYGAKWTHDETVIALGLYFQIPFGKINQTTPEVVRIARLMGREPASLSMKMGNIGRLDPTLAQRGVTGLKNGAKMEVEVWNEYAGRREELAEIYSELLLKLQGHLPLEDDQQIKTPPGAEYFAKFEGVQIRLPTRSRPVPAFLDYHRDHIFVR